MFATASPSLLPGLVTVSPQTSNKRAELKGLGCWGTFCTHQAPRRCPRPPAPYDHPPIGVLAPLNTPVNLARSLTCCACTRWHGHAWARTRMRARLRNPHAVQDLH